MACRRTNPDFQNGVPELLVLNQLRRAEMYGYEIARAIHVATGEVIPVGEGVLYPVLHALERGGFLRSRTEKVNGRPRVYYRLTRRGRARLKERAGQWERIAGAVARALARGESRGLPA